MKTQEELEKIAKEIIEKINLSDEESKVLLLSADYAAISNILNDQSKELRYLIYGDLKEEFEDN